MNNQPNPTIKRTQFILPTFVQDWLISNDPVSIDDKKLETILSEVKQAKEVLLTLFVEAEYTREQREYLADLIKKMSYYEDWIIALNNKNNLSRNQIKDELDILYIEFTSTFRVFISFYDLSITE